MTHKFAVGDFVTCPSGLACDFDMSYWCGTGEFVGTVIKVLDPDPNNNVFEFTYTVHWPYDYEDGIIYHRESELEYAGPGF